MVSLHKGPRTVVAEDSWVPAELPSYVEKRGRARTGCLGRGSGSVISSLDWESPVLERVSLEGPSKAVDRARTSFFAAPSLDPDVAVGIVEVYEMARRKKAACRGLLQLSGLDVLKAQIVV